jgi:alpha-D-ribose 1-methylphosphonate 5-triphosphate synthase subunit PhnH
MEAALDGGFADAPRDAAHAFRAAMNVMARPGRIERLAGARPPAPLSVAAGVLVLTLCDPETPVHLAGSHDTPEVRGWIAFHTGAPVVGRAQAAFAVGTWEALGPLEGYRIGEAEYPDRSATLIVEMADLRAEGAALTGPGIRDTARLSLLETEAFCLNARHFPLGLDFFLTAGDRVAALPRTTRVG